MTDYVDTAAKALEWTLDYIEGTEARTRPPEAEPFLSERIARYRAFALAATPPALDPKALAKAAADVSHGGIVTSEYWRGFNDGVDALAARLTDTAPETK